MKRVGTEPRPHAKVPHQQQETVRPQTITQPRAPVQTPDSKSDFRSTPIAQSQRPVPTSRIHFNVHPGLDEVKRYAEQKGWLAEGFTQLSTPWMDLVYTTDNWKTTQTLRSTDVPSPIVNGFFSMPNVPKGTEIEFAIHVGVACSSPHDIGGNRERGDVWLNNNGQNYRQVSQ
jgi:hypothetical protein